MNRIKLNRRLHAAFLMRGLERPLTSSFLGLDASRPWLCYWILHSLDLLGMRPNTTLLGRLLTTLATCQHPSGGFGGGPGQTAHLACTFAAISSLAIIGTEEAYKLVNRITLRSFLLRMKGAQGKSERYAGGFTVHDDGECDVRGSYCALAVAHLTNLLDDELRQGTAAFIVSCQSHWEGGIGALPGAEAHAGYTYCGLAALAILARRDQSGLAEDEESRFFFEDVITGLDLHGLARFAVRSQCPRAGGFRGRTNKLVDACYSFWAGALFPLLRRMAPGPYFQGGPLQRYLLVACQGSSGGLRDKPGKSEDYYHTCYGLSGLALAQHERAGELPIDGGLVMGDPTNLLPCPLPEYNLLPARVNRMQAYYRQVGSTVAC